MAWTDFFTGKGEGSFTEQALKQRQAELAKQQEEDAYREKYKAGGGQILSQGDAHSPVGDLVSSGLEWLGLGGKGAYDFGQKIEHAAELSPYGSMKQVKEGDFAGAMENLVGGPEMAMAAAPAKKLTNEAVEAGRDTLARIRAFHATRSNFDKFGPAPEYRGSTYLATTPEAAKKGATGGAQDFYRTEGPQPPLQTLEVEIPDEGIQGLHWTPEEHAWYKQMPERLVGDEALNAAFKGQPNHGQIPWDDVYEPHQIGDRLYEYVKKPPRTYSLDEVSKTNRDIYYKQLPGYQASDKETAARLREQGMHGFLVNDEAGVSIAHINPETIQIVKKLGVAAAVTAGMITASQAEELRQQGYDE